MSSGTQTQSHDISASGTNVVTLRYFAWVREKVGHAEEKIEMPSHVKTVAELVDWLRSRGETYAAAFTRPEVIRVAIDQTHVRPDTAIDGAREIAFFPPVTGG